MGDGVTRVGVTSTASSIDDTLHQSLKYDIVHILLKGDNCMSTLQAFPLQTADQLSVHIRSLRKLRGLTQAQLGARIGVKQVRVADIEHNPGSISVEQLLQVLHALDARLQLVDTKAHAVAKTTPLVARDSSEDW